MSREFPQGEAGGGYGIQGRRQFLENGQTGQAMHIQGRLAIAGAGEFFAGAFKHDGGERFPQGFVGLLNQGFGGRILVIQIFAHAHLLGTLSGKQ